MNAARRKRVKAKPRRIYCTPEERSAIAQLAAEAGMSMSAYMVACALPDEDDERTGCALVLSEAEQSALIECVERLERGLRTLLAPGADTGVSLLQGLELLVGQQRPSAPHSGRRRAS